MATNATNENIYIPLQPLFILARIFGLADIQFFNGEKNEIKIRFQHIILACLWNTVFVIAMCYSVYVVFYNNHGLPDKVNMIVIFYYTTLCGTNIVTSVSSSINRKKIASILQKLMNIDVIIKDKEAAEFYRKTNKEVLRQIAALSLFIVIAFPIDLYVTTGNTLTHSLCRGLEYLSCSSNVVTLLLYINMVRIVRHRYKKIFESLENHVEGNDISAVKCTNHFLELHRGCCELQNIRRPSLQLLSNRSNHVQTLRLLYIEMYDTVQLIASHFGAPVLIQTLSVMMMCVLMLYSAFYFIYSADANSHGVKTYVIFCYLIFWAVIYITPFIWLVISCDQTAHEANRGVIYIQRVKASPHMGHDAVMELEKLSSQLKDMKVEFSVCGLVVLNLQLLCTFVGGIFTYILVMVQLN
jgi:hypothetical protein